MREDLEVKVEVAMGWSEVVVGVVVGSSCTLHAYKPSNTP